MNFSRITRKPPSAVDRVAHDLRGIVRRKQDGDFVGSELTLAAEFQVSGPTLRQAIRILEGEELISVRRGVRGGYFAKRPTLDFVSRSAASYIWGNIDSFHEISDLVLYITPLVVESILNSGRLEELEKFVEISPSQSMEDFVSVQREFVRMYWDLTENMSLRLIGAIFIQTSLDARNASRIAPSTVKLLENLRNRLVYALLRRDHDGSVSAATTLRMATHKALMRSIREDNERWDKSHSPVGIAGDREIVSKADTSAVT